MVARRQTLGLRLLYLSLGCLTQSQSANLPAISLFSPSTTCSLSLNWMWPLLILSFAARRPACVTRTLHATSHKKKNLPHTWESLHREAWVSHGGFETVTLPVNTTLYSPKYSCMVMTYSLISTLRPGLTSFRTFAVTVYCNVSHRSLYCIQCTC